MSVESLNSYADTDKSINTQSSSDDMCDDSRESPKRFYGWKRCTEKIDPDLKLINKAFFKNPTLINFPPSFELNDMPPVYDQGKLGSCTANAVCNMYRYGKQQVKKKSLNNSRRAECSYTTTND